MISMTMSAISARTADALDAYPGHMMDGWDMWPFWPWMLAAWMVMLVVAVLVYLDARERDMNGLLWAILVLVPVAGLLFLAIYLVVRDDAYLYEMSRKSPEAVLGERYARGYITQEEYLQMKACLGED